MSSCHNARVAVIACTPMAHITGPAGQTVCEPIDPRWHRARMGLSFGTNINVSEMCCDGLEIGDARSRIAARCRELAPKPFSLFFLDSDVIVPNDAFTKLFYHLKTKPDIDVACGIYVVKGSPPYDPLIYAGNGMGAFWDFAVGDILTTKQHGITACHMGLTLIRTSMFDRLVNAGLVHGDGTDQGDCPFYRTQNHRLDGPGGVATFKGTEDIWFCGLGEKLDPPMQFLVDTSVLAGHVDRKSGIVYGVPGDSAPIERAKWLPRPDGSGLRMDRKEADDAGLKLAIDLGSGESHREWEGYRTYRLDSRRDCNPDYCQEMEQLNLPEDHYDLVASRHSFEHVGRFQQERLWSEAFRICKPGGRLEIIVPNLLWAAHKIIAGEIDQHVFNVIYGGAETDDDMGESGAVFNIHKFGYTPDVVRSLAESAGFVDVKTMDWRDDPRHEYHMLVTASKPSRVQAADGNGDTSAQDKSMSEIVKRLNCERVLS